MNSYASFVARAARLFGDRTALIDGVRSHTFHDLEISAQQVASGFRSLGIEPGQRVADLGSNRLEAIELDFGLARGGFVRVALPELSSPENHESMLTDCKPVALVCGPGYEDQGRQLAAAVPSITNVILEDTSVNAGHGEQYYTDLCENNSEAITHTGAAEDNLLSLRYTGGTTGRPKGVKRTHADQVAVAASILLDLCDLSASDVVVHATPLSHGANPYVLPALIRGSVQVIGRSFDAGHLLQLIEQYGGTVTKIVPPGMLRALIDAHTHGPDAGRDIGSLRLLICGSAPLPGPLQAEAVETFGEVIAQTYGQTEMPLGIVSCTPEELSGRRGPYGLRPTGRPYSLCDVAVQDSEGYAVKCGTIGDVVVRVGGIWHGYWGVESEDTETDMWWGTDDIGVFDEEGYLYVLGRRGEALATDEGMIFPRVIEEAIYSHAGVREAIVTTVVHEDGTEMIGALIARRPGSSADVAALEAHCRAQLSESLVPKVIVFCDEVPKSPTGKLLRRSAQVLLAGSEEPEI